MENNQQPQPQQPPSPQSAKDFFIEGISDVSDERLRQITEEGYSAANDDKNELGAMAAAGACYAIYGAFKRNNGNVVLPGVPEWWPWVADSWKPSEDIRRNLVKAAALIIAEIDRIDREKAS